MKQELNQLSFSKDCIIDDIVGVDIHTNLRKAIEEFSKQQTYRNCEIIFNSKHLKAVRHKLNDTVTYFGINCDFSHLEDDLSFILRPVIGKQKIKSLEDYSSKELLEELSKRV